MYGHWVTPARVFTALFCLSVFAGGGKIKNKKQERLLFCALLMDVEISGVWITEVPRIA